MTIVKIKNILNELIREEFKPLIMNNYSKFDNVLLYDLEKNGIINAEKVFVHKVEQKFKISIKEFKITSTTNTIDVDIKVNQKLLEVLYKNDVNSDYVDELIYQESINEDSNKIYAKAKFMLVDKNTAEKWLLNRLSKKCSNKNINGDEFKKSFVEYVKILNKNSDNKNFEFNLDEITNKLSNNHK